VKVSARRDGVNYLTMEANVCFKLQFHVQYNQINAATILQALAGLLQHTLILFYCTLNHICNIFNAAIKQNRTFILLQHLFCFILLHLKHNFVRY